MIKCLPLEVVAMDGLVTDGALPPGVIGQGQVMKDARPAEHMAASGYLGSSRWVKTAKVDRTNTL